MRITSGKFGGIPLKSPPGDRLRPTQDLVREALFSILRDKIDGCVFLDLCSGTGAVGLEALSRGAQSAVLVEKNRANAKYIQTNAEMLKGMDPKIFFGDSVGLLKSFRNRYRFDVIFADPPYEKYGENPLLKNILKMIAEGDLLNDDGVVVFEQAKKENTIEHSDFEIYKEKNYGRTKLIFYRKSLES